MDIPSHFLLEDGMRLPRITALKEAKVPFAPRTQRLSQVGFFSMEAETLRTRTKTPGSDVLAGIRVILECVLTLREVK